MDKVSIQNFAVHQFGRCISTQIRHIFRNKFHRPARFISPHEYDSRAFFNDFPYATQFPCRIVFFRNIYNVTTYPDKFPLIVKLTYNIFANHNWCSIHPDSMGFKVFQFSLFSQQSQKMLPVRLPGIETGHIRLLSLLQ